VITDALLLRRQRQRRAVRRRQTGLRRYRLTTLNMDVDKVAAAVTPQTKAIVAVEIFGHPAA
jgi:hypothetical protein